MILIRLLTVDLVAMETVQMFVWQLRHWEMLNAATPHFCLYIYLWPIL